MRGIRHTVAVLVTLLTVAGMAVASLAQARSNWWQLDASYSDAHNMRVCVDKLYRTTHCGVMTSPLYDNRLLWYKPLYTSHNSNHLFFALKKSRCFDKKPRRRPTLLRVLFPNIPDLRIDLDSFALNVKVPSNPDEFELSTIHLGYRNCW